MNEDDAVTTDAGPTPPAASDATTPAAGLPETAAPSGPVDEFAATRERVADPDDWRLEARPLEKDTDAKPAPVPLDPAAEAKARRLRALVHVGAAGAAVITLAALALHVLDVGPTGLSTWLIALALLAAAGAAWAFPLADFPMRAAQGGPEAWSRTRYHREVTQKSFGVGFGLLLVVLGFLELIAFFVAIRLVPDLSGTSLTLARHFIFIPAIAIAGMLAAIYVRVAMPSLETPARHERVILLGSLAAGGLALVLSSFFAIGIPAVVAFTTVKAHQAIYIAGVASAAGLVIANLRLALPNVLAIVRKEIQKSKEVDRRSAETMQKKMMRNYLFALVFVIGSIGFLVGKAAGVVKTGEGGSLDIVLLVYLALGVLFLGTVLVNYYQSKQIRRHVVLRKDMSVGPGKRRYSPQQVTLFILLGVSGTVSFLFLMVMLLVVTGKMTALGGPDIPTTYATDLFVFALLSAIGPYGFYYARESSRIRAIDEKFPEFLRDLAESQRAGMTLPRALLTASKGVYGPLTGEIRIMAAQVEWGVSFSEALRRFAGRTRTPLIERTVSLVCEAAASGGNVVDILSAASDDSREIKNILAERKAAMGVYSLIIYIAFGVFLTVIAVLNSQFIPQLAKSTAQVAGSSLGGIQFGVIDVPHYQRLFWHAALIQGIGGGFVAGVMTEGSPQAGLRHAFIMTVVAYVVFRFIII